MVTKIDKDELKAALKLAQAIPKESIHRELRRALNFSDVYIETIVNIYGLMTEGSLTKEEQLDVIMSIQNENKRAAQILLNYMPKELKEDYHKHK